MRGAFPVRDRVIVVETNQRELGDFLRSRREKLPAASVGLPTRRRRRTPGLRREEVAELAGIGVDWYVRLEQGRTVRPSTTTIDALAGALRLDGAERAHLHALARRPQRQAFVRESLPDPLRRLLDSLAQPAYVTGRRWDVLGWNDPAAATFTDFAALDAEDCNILAYMLVNPDARRLFGAAWADEARLVVAKFRATHDLWADDPAFVQLLERLKVESPEFPIWWETHEIHSGEGGTKLLHHPTMGARRFEYATFQANDDPALKLAIYTQLG